LSRGHSISFADGSSGLLVPRAVIWRNVWIIFCPYSTTLFCLIAVLKVVRVRMTIKKCTEVIQHILQLFCWGL